MFNGTGNLRREACFMLRLKEHIVSGIHASQHVRACNEEWSKMLWGNLWALLMMHYPQAFTHQSKIPSWIFYVSASSRRHYFQFELLNMCGSRTEPPLFDFEVLTPIADVLKWKLSQESEKSPNIPSIFSIFPGRGDFSFKVQLFSIARSDGLTLHYQLLT